MSPRVELNKDLTATPTQKKPWERFAPSPSNASPSASILKKASDDPSQPPPKRRRVQFTDPPVSDQAIIPRCPSGKQTRGKLEKSRYNRDMFLNVAKDLSKDDQDSSGLYEATPPMLQDHPEVPNNCIYPALVDCDEPVTSILHNLTTPTWHKAAEKHLSDQKIKTIGDLSKLTTVKASALKSLKPPNNLFTIKEALRKFEKSWLRRGKDKYTEKKSLNTSVEELVESEASEDLTAENKKEQSPTAAPVVDVQSTPEEEDETMKELYERPSPSPTESIELIEKSQESILDEASEKNILDEGSEKNTIEREIEKENQAMEQNTEAEETIEIVSEKDTKETDVQAVQETTEMEVQASPVLKHNETMTNIVSKEDVSVQKGVESTETSTNTENNALASVSVQSEEISKQDKLKDLLEFMTDLDVSDLTEVIAKAAQVIKDKTTCK